MTWLDEPLFAGSTSVRASLRVWWKLLAYPGKPWAQALSLVDETAQEAQSVTSTYTPAQAVWKFDPFVGACMRVSDTVPSNTAAHEAVLAPLSLAARVKTAYVVVSAVGMVGVVVGAWAGQWWAAGVAAAVAVGAAAAAVWLGRVLRRALSELVLLSADPRTPPGVVLEAAGQVQPSVLGAKAKLDSGVSLSEAVAGEGEAVQAWAQTVSAGTAGGVGGVGVGTVSVNVSWSFVIAPVFLGVAGAVYTLLLV